MWYEMITKRKIRYILVESSEPIDAGANFLQIRDGIAHFIGELGAVEANIRFIKQYGPSLFAVSANRGTEKRAVAAFSMVKQVNGKPIGFYTLKTSGTLKSISEFAATLG